MAKLGVALAALPESQETSNFGRRSEIERLFELALAAELPRARPLKDWEPQRMNERHLAMIMARAGGLKQREIAQAFGATDSNVSIILNHPDAEYLLARLQAMKSEQPGSIEARLRALSERAVGVLEDLFEEEDIKTLHKVPHAFRVLENNGYAAPKKAEVEIKSSLSDASSHQLGLLTRALQEHVRIQDAHVVDSMPSVSLLPPGEEPHVP